MAIQNASDFFEWLKIVIVGGGYLVWQSIKSAFGVK